MFWLNDLAPPPDAHAHAVTDNSATLYPRQNGWAQRHDHDKMTDDKDGGLRRSFTFLQETKIEENTNYIQALSPPNIDILVSELFSVLRTIDQNHVNKVFLNKLYVRASVFVRGLYKSLPHSISSLEIVVEIETLQVFRTIIHQVFQNVVILKNKTQPNAVPSCCIQLFANLQVSMTILERTFSGLNPGPPQRNCSLESSVTSSSRLRICRGCS